MKQSNHLITINLDSEAAVEQVSRRLSDDGFQIVRSFDLQTARSAHTNCSCPYHGMEGCDCQLIVLLVYNQQGQSLTLVAHSQDNKTHFELVESPQQRPQRQIKAAVLQALALEGFVAIRNSKSAHAT